MTDWYQSPGAQVPMEIMEINIRNISTPWKRDDNASSTRNIVQTKLRVPSVEPAITAKNLW